MARVRRIVRKTEPLARRGFDEQFWPIILALFVLGGFLAGTVLAYLPLREGPWHARASTWLFAIALAVCLLIWALRHVSSRLVRRGLQLSAVLCLIVHVVLFVVSHETTVFGGRDLERPDTAQRKPPRRPVDTRYEPTQFESRSIASRDLIRPVTPRSAQAAPQELAEQTPDRQDASVPLQPLPTLRSEVSPTPHVVPRATPAETSPCQSEHLSPASRRLADARPVPSFASVDARPAADARPVPTAAASPGPERHLAAPSTGRADASPPTPTTNPGPAALVRRDSQPAPASVAVPQPQFRRQLDHPLLVPRSELDLADVASVPRRDPAHELAPGIAGLDRQPTRSADVDRRERSPRSEAVVNAAEPAKRREERTESQPTLARTPASVPNRRARLTERPAVATAAASIADRGEAAPISRSSPAPPSVAISRQPEAQPANAEPARTAPEVVPTFTANTARKTERSDSGQSAPTATSMVAGLTSRQVRAAPTSTSTPTNDAQTPTTTRAEQGTGTLAAEPARFALSKSVAGTAGAGSSANLDRAPPAAPSPAAVASGAARRREATQAEPAGPALAPSQIARVRGAIAGREAPSTPLVPNASDLADRPAGDRTGERAMTAGATLSRDGSQATRATTTAAAGTIDVDVGPTLVVNEAGLGRGSGGGQEVFNPETDSPRMARRRPAGTPPTALSAGIATPAETSPGGENADSPLSPSSVEPSELARTKPDEGQASAEGPVIDSGQEIGAKLENAGDAIATEAGGGEFVSSARIGRAEAVEAAEGAPEPGGGTGSPTRSVRDPTWIESAPVGDPVLAGTEQAGGYATGSPLASQGLEPHPRSGGVPAPVADSPVGALADDLAMDGLANGVREAALSRHDGTASATGEEAVAQDLASATFPKRERSSAPSFSTAVPLADSAPFASANNAASEPDTGLLAANSGLGRQTRGAAAAIPVDIPADEGPGGLGPPADWDLGLTDGGARSESAQLSPRASRFIRDDFGGPRDFNPTVGVPTEPFRRRSERTAAPPTGSATIGPGPQTEEAIERGLAFLARYQQPDGSWSLRAFGEQTSLTSDTAATGLALLAFQGAGYNHREHHYAPVVRAGLEYLIRNQQENGDLFLPADSVSNRSVWLYSHSIAALALCEAFGMTQDPELRAPAEKAIVFIATSQDKEYGGWRYTPGVGSDTSVTGWMMMALKSGELAGLKVPESTYGLARRWLDLAQAGRTEQHLYRYNPLAPDTPSQRHGQLPSQTMTAVGLLLRLYDGWRRDKEVMMRGADYLSRNLPAIGSARSPERDTYYWYYGSQVMFHMGGKYWEEWNGRLHPLLVNSQVKEGRFAGSWNPRLPVPDRWGPHAGRLYVTALNLLSLEVYYRHLPLYEDTAR